MSASSWSTDPGTGSSYSPRWPEARGGWLRSDAPVLHLPPQPGEGEDDPVPQTMAHRPGNPQRSEGAHDERGGKLPHPLMVRIEGDDADDVGSGRRESVSEQQVAAVGCDRRNPGVRFIEVGAMEGIKVGY